MKNLRLDVTPAIIFKPRFASQGDIKEQIAETQGFCFYVEAMNKEPELILMKNYNLTSKTIGDIPDVPKDMLQSAVADPKAKPIGGMYTITAELEAWIKKELGV